MFDYMRSNCDIGFKTVWSELLTYTKEDFHGSFYKDFSRNDIYVHATSVMMSLESCDPKCYHLAQK